MGDDASLQGRESISSLKQPSQRWGELRGADDSVRVPFLAEVYASQVMEHGVIPTTAVGRARSVKEGPCEARPWCGRAGGKKTECPFSTPRKGVVL
jgi:hypothetical protein